MIRRRSSHHWRINVGIHDLWLFVLSGLLLNISPGPDTAYILGRSAQLGWRGGATAALGIGTGILVHVTAAAAGVSALLAASAAAFTIVKYLGAAYLVYIGARMLLARSRGEEPGPNLDCGATRLSVVFFQGFLTNVLNPKVALFFLAFLPQFVDADAPSKALALLFLGLLFGFNGTLWCLFIAWLSARASAAFRKNRKAHDWINRTLGSLFIYLGLRLAAAER